MSKVHVRGNDKSDIYKWLTTKSLNGVSGEEVMWNFNKFLIDEKGNLVQHLGSGTEPFDDKILQWIH